MSIWAERRVKPRTVNDLLARVRHASAKERREWREWARDEFDGVPALVGPVTVTVTHLRPNRAAPPDLGAPFIAVKGLIDGLVDAGALPGDGPDIVQRLAFLPYEVTGFHGLRVVVREIETHAPHTPSGGMKL